ncbi:SWIM zinc finger family protein [Haloferax elongans]|uniref:SWIM zinc finger family protein n=1 Tax=Haloferax elongans TaxID=403191 RepID=UPI00126762B3
MTVKQNDIHDQCTDAVFGRGKNYYKKGQIHDCARVGDTVTATVQGSKLYDLTLSLSAPDFDPSCSCPYDGPGTCKHVVAVLLLLADEIPSDRGSKIGAVLIDIDEDNLHSFLRDELSRDSGMLDRFLARFGTGPVKSHTEYQNDVDLLFEDHTDNYPVVVDAIDFSQFTDIAEHYRKRGRYRQAAAVYRGLIAGLDDNIHLVDAAYDYYAEVFREGLDAYVDCIAAADLDPHEREEYETFLAERAETGAGPHQEQFRRALSVLLSVADDRANS